MEKEKSISLSLAPPKGQSTNKVPKKNKWVKKLRALKENYPFYIMLFPALLVVFLFNYLPIYGVLIAFQDFMPGDPIFSKFTHWVGFHNFIRFRFRFLLH